MRTTLAVTVQPSGEPVTVAQVKQHCRIDSDADDDLLAGYLSAARIMAEGYLSRVLLTQTLRWTVQADGMRERAQRRRRAWAWEALELPRAPVQSVASVTAVDRWGNMTAIAPAVLPVVAGSAVSGWTADLAYEPAVLRIGRQTLLSDGRLLEDVSLESMQVVMVAGYGAASAVPMNIATAIMMTTAFLYEHRGDAGGDMPDAARWLLDRDRLQFLGG